MLRVGVAPPRVERCSNQTLLRNPTTPKELKKRQAHLLTINCAGGYGFEVLLGLKVLK